MYVIYIVIYVYIVTSPMQSVSEKFPKQFTYLACQILALVQGRNFLPGGINVTANRTNVQTRRLIIDTKR